MTEYVALIPKDAGSEFGVSLPDFPGCITAGRDLDEARGMAEEALALHIEGLLEDGHVLPLPSDLEAIMADPQNRDGIALLVPAQAARSEPTSVHMTLSLDDLRAIDAYARDHGMTRSSFLAAAVRTKLQEPA